MADPTPTPAGAPDAVAPDAVKFGSVQMMDRDHARMRKAGTALAEAALYVIREYDGTHRLSLAVADWAKAVADEGDRARHPRPDAQPSGNTGELDRPRCRGCVDGENGVRGIWTDTGGNFDYVSCCQSSHPREDAGPGELIAGVEGLEAPGCPMLGACACPGGEERLSNLAGQFKRERDEARAALATARREAEERVFEQSLALVRSLLVQRSRDYDQIGADSHGVRGQALLDVIDAIEAAQQRARAPEREQGEGAGQ